MTGEVPALLRGIAVALGLATAGLAALSLVSAARAVRLGGFRLLFDGMAWFFPPEHIPPSARPHLRLALKRWLLAIGTMLLAAGAAALSQVLA